MLTDGLATTAASTKGNLPDRNGYDIHCPMMGGPDYKLNYCSTGCRERQLMSSCTKKGCDRRVNLVRPNLVQVSAATKRQALNTEVMPVDKRPVRECAECGRMMSISGRGLCSTCLKKMKKDGTLDEKHPPLRPGRRPAKAEKPETVAEPVSLVADDADEDPRIVRLEFWERDCVVLVELEKWAAEDRRSVADQILFALDNIIYERTQGATP